MKSGNFLLFFCCLLGSLSSHVSFADSTMDLKQLERAAQQFLYKEFLEETPEEDNTSVKVSIRPIDSRMRLARCDDNLTFKLKNRPIQRKSSIRIICPGSKTWSLFVSGTVSIEKPIVVIRQELPRLHILSQDDLMTVMRDTASLRGGYNTQLQSLVGMQLKRSARSGDVIYNFQLQLPDIIKKGDLVTVHSIRGTLTVSMPGVAMSDGSKGEKIRVENQRSSRIIQARVTGPGSVEVIL